MALRAKSPEHPRIPLHCRVSPTSLTVIEQQSGAHGNTGRAIDQLLSELTRIRTKREEIERFLMSPDADYLPSASIARALHCSTSLVEIVRSELLRRATFDRTGNAIPFES